MVARHRGTTRLASLERTACLAIIGAVRSTPDAALNCSQDLTPRDMYIKTEVRREAYHLQLGWLQLGGHGLTRITSTITGSGTLDMVHDHVDKRNSFSKSFESIITGRQSVLH